MLECCTNCQTRILFGGQRDAAGVFCSWQCQTWFWQVQLDLPPFCDHCLAETTEQSSGSTYTLNGIGTSLFGWAQPCPQCSSAVRTKCICVFFIPLIPLGKYRVKFSTPQQFISRRLVRRLPRLPPPPTMQSPFAAPAVNYAAPSTAPPPSVGGAFGPAPSAEPGTWAFRCPRCGSPEPAVRQSKVSTAGWIVFALLLVLCFPLCFLGLLIREESLTCATCGAPLG
jgi:hypothetical protein